MALAAISYLNDTSRQLTNAIERDRSNFLEKHADDAKASFINNDSRGLWQSVKKLLRFGGRPARIGVDHAFIIDEEGNPIPDSTAQAEAELDYFAKAEHSIITDAEDIATKYNRNAMSAATTRVLFDTPIENIMTKEENKAAFTIAKMGRRGGTDGLTDDLCRIAPDQMTRLYHPLLVKSQMATVEPLSHKGGWQTSFSKPNATKPDMASRRMILLNNIVAKHHHRFLRNRLKTITAMLLRDAQSGARPHQSTDFVTHTTLGYKDFLRYTASSGIIMFIDLKDAFYRVVLQFAYKLPTTPEELNDLLHDISIPEALLPALEAAMEGAPVFDHNVEDEHLCALLRDAHTDMWATTKGSQRFAKPRTGTRPGVPASDLTFNYVFARVTGHIAEDIIKADIHIDIPIDESHMHLSKGRTTTPGEDGGRALTDTSFVDDMNAYSRIHQNDPSTVVNTATTLANIIVKWTLAHGMKLHANKNQNHAPT